MRGLALICAASALSWAAPASAASPELGDPGVPAEPAIFGGEELEPCAWPTAVSVQTGGMLCTGTLVHPRLVMYAAHCSASSSTRVRFGEDINDAKIVNPDLCETYPDYLGLADQGNDWAFCRLPEPVDLPTTPILYGCELDALVPDAEVAIVGFGWNADTVGAGIKRWGLTTLTTVDFESNKGELGGDGGPSICPGDSGGPAYIRLSDGSWRAWGIGSTVTNGCGGVGTYSLMQGAMDWVQERSGIDLTPCFDAEGEWAPTGLCQNFHAAEPAAAFGDYESEPWCAGTPATGAGDFCGDPYDAQPDEEAPQVQITYPLDQESFADNPSALTITVDATDVGWGIKGVRIEIDGQDIGVYDELLPYEQPGVTFPGPASYSIVAIAEDFAGQVTASDPVEIHVAQPEPGEESGEEAGESENDTDASGESESSEVGSDGDPSQDESGDGGCQCDTRRRGGVPAGLALLGLLAWRRRRW